MKLTLGNLRYISKNLATAAHEASVTVPLDPPITPGESAVIEFLIARRKPCSIREIVSGTGIAQSWVSTVVKSLQARDWVELAQDVKDKRVTTVTMTKKIYKEAKQVLSRDAKFALSSLLKNATPEEILVIEAGLTALSDVLQRSDPDAFKAY